MPAVGYRFNISGRWSEPDESLEQVEEWGDATVLSEQADFRLDTLFKDSSGEACGRHYVKFVRGSTEAKSESLTYLVDNLDLGDLLRSIGSCAGTTRR